MKQQCYCICIRGSLFYAVSLVHVSAEEERKSDAICALLLWGEPGHHCLPAPFGYGSSAFAAKLYNRCLIQINFRRLACISIIRPVTTRELFIDIRLSLHL